MNAVTQPSHTTDVVEYEKENIGAKYGMKAGIFAAKFASDTLKEILKDAKKMALKGLYRVRHQRFRVQVAFQ